jgi:hypothetical protein
MLGSFPRASCPGRNIRPVQRARQGSDGHGQRRLVPRAIGMLSRRRLDRPAGSRQVDPGFPREHHRREAVTQVEFMRSMVGPAVNSLRPTCVRPSSSADAVGARRDDHLKSLNRHRTDEDGLSVAVLCTAFCAATGCTEGETASARDRGVAGPLRAGVAARNGASRGFVRLDREPVRRAVRRPVRNCRGGRCESALFWRAGRVPGAARGPAILRRLLRRRGRTVRR